MVIWGGVLFVGEASICAGKGGGGSAPLPIRQGLITRKPGALGSSQGNGRATLFSWIEGPMAHLNVPCHAKHKSVLETRRHGTLLILVVVVSGAVFEVVELPSRHPSGGAPFPLKKNTMPKKGAKSKAKPKKAEQTSAPASRASSIFAKVIEEIQE